MLYHNKLIKSVVIILAFIILLIISGIIWICWDSDEIKYYEKGIDDNTVVKLEKPVNSINDGMPYAIKRVNQWRSDLYMVHMDISFKTKSEILNKKGIIRYYFSGRNVKNELNAEVDIDMNSNSITKFSSYYAPKTSGGDAINYNKKYISIPEIFDIAYKTIGEDKIMNHETPNMFIRCWSDDWWEIAVLNNSKFTSDDYLVKFDPETGNILSAEDMKNKQKLEIKK